MKGSRKVGSLSSSPSLVVVTENRLKEMIEETMVQVLQRFAGPDMEQMKRLTPEGVRKLAHVRRQTVFDALSDGSLPAKRRGRRWSIRQEDVMRWIDSLGT